MILLLGSPYANVQRANSARKEKEKKSFSDFLSWPFWRDAQTATNNENIYYLSNYSEISSEKLVNSSSPSINHLFNLNWKIIYKIINCNFDLTYFKVKACYIFDITTAKN